MASCRSLLSEEQIACSICLSVFTAPVSIPCGHNFCKACISNYWETADLCQCPLCKDTFYRRPELRVKSVRDFVENVKRMKVRDEEMSLSRPGEVPYDVRDELKSPIRPGEVSGDVRDDEKSPARPGEVPCDVRDELKSPIRPGEVPCGVRDDEKSPARPGEVPCDVRDGKNPPARPGEVSCDVCTGRKLKALKSCLVCLTTYCETHLEPHVRVARLKKHKLIHPVENLEDRMCKKHDKLLELFCRKEQTCVCLMCTNTDHRTHDAVPLEEESRQRKAHLGKMRADIDRMMKTRSMKVQQIKLSVETSKRDADREISDSVEVFAALVRSIERSQAALIRAIEEKLKAAEKRAEGFIRELEKEITELKRRSSELEKLSHADDHLHLLQTFPSLSTPPHTKDWSQVSVHSGLSVGTILSQLENSLMKDIDELREVELKRIQRHAVDVSLDSETAHPKLILSEDGKQVRHGDACKNLPDNRKRFDGCVMVLGNRGFSSGRFYYEVQVGGKTEWALGVAEESVNRKGTVITFNPENGYWTMMLRKGNEYRALARPAVLLHPRDKPQKVGVFVDYVEGRVSFYNVESGSHIYSFTGCTFTENLYPFLSPGVNYGGTNSSPLIITPVTHTASVVENSKHI